MKRSKSKSTKLQVLRKYLVEEGIKLGFIVTLWIALLCFVGPILFDSRSNLGLVGAWFVWMGLGVLTVSAPFWIIRDYREFHKRYLAARE